MYYMTASKITTAAAIRLQIMLADMKMVAATSPGGCGLVPIVLVGGVVRQSNTSLIH